MDYDPKDDHPFLPPDELINEWLNMNGDNPVPRFNINQFASWVANRIKRVADSLRAAFRPKPPSLKQQALAIVTQLQAGDAIPRNGEAIDTIRRALEALPK